MRSRNPYVYIYTYILKNYILEIAGKYTKLKE